MTDSRTTRGRTLGAAAALSCAAAFAHGWAAPGHFTRWWGYGAFFVTAGVLQAAFAVKLLDRPGAPLVAAGLVAQSALISLHLVSATSGVPAGPLAGTPVAIEFVDVARGLAESGVAALLAFHLIGTARRRLRFVVPAAVLIVAVLASAAPAALREGAAPSAIRGQAAPPLAAPSGAVVLPADDPTLPETTTVGLPARGTPYVPEETENELPPPCIPKVADPLPRAKPPAGSEATAVVYENNGNLMLYDATQDRIRPITAEPEPSETSDPCWSQDPVFRSDYEIVYTSGWGRSLNLLDLNSGKQRVITQPSFGVSSFGLSPDGGWVAVATSNSKGAPLIYVAALESAETRMVATFDGVVASGHCGSAGDESSIAWSPDGTTLLFVMTHLTPEVNEESAVDELPQPDTMYVLDPAGKTLVSRVATHPRWSPDSDTVVYQTYDEHGRWFALDVASGRDTPLPMTAGTSEISFSPGGTLIAHASTAVDATYVYVFDVVAQTEKLIARHHAGPLWLSSGRLALSKIGKCEDCFDDWYEAVGVSRIAATGGTAEPIALTTTRGASALMPR